ncbi:unnamed protein product [Owenia fusiformis]|uniref:Cyclic nucleotide-binding domain-containing protein n=1 Tax=Owenia fusiformis TaxID=6347 RepID=A0A8S4N739_OWEFU|nr:unnamed protein product [Owenia fusiformis]
MSVAVQNIAEGQFFSKGKKRRKSKHKLKPRAEDLAHLGRSRVLGRLVKQEVIKLNSRGGITGILESRGKSRGTVGTLESRGKSRGGQGNGLSKSMSSLDGVQLKRGNLHKERSFMTQAESNLSLNNVGDLPLKRMSKLTLKSKLEYNTNQRRRARPSVQFELSPGPDDDTFTGYEFPDGSEFDETDEMDDELLSPTRTTTRAHSIRSARTNSITGSHSPRIPSQGSNPNELSPRRRHSIRRLSKVSDSSGPKIFKLHQGFHDIMGTIARRKSVMRKMARKGSLAQENGDQDAETNIVNAIEHEVENDWILREAQRKSQEEFDKRNASLRIVRLTDDDPLLPIQKRMQEVHEMVRPKREVENIMQQVNEESRKMIMDMGNLAYSEFRRQRRKDWTLKDRFRYAARMALMLCKAFMFRKNYYIAEKAGVPGKTKTQNETITEGMAKLRSSKASVGQEMEWALTTQPEFRSNKQHAKAMWMLRATKAFKSLFPAEMEGELGRLLAYERYDDGRIIAKQGVPPQRFYYFLTGRVNKMRHYKLNNGVVTKAMGHLGKGMTTDAEEMEREWRLEYDLVCKGPVEVLILDKESFMYLLNTTQGPPIDFLRTIDLFQEFPVEEFRCNLDTIECRYHAPNKMVVKDANRTPWLHIVKSGFVKVIRIQNVIDTRQDNLFDTQNEQEMGSGKSFSHADAMLGVMAKQKKMKTMLSLPEISTIKDNNIVSNPYGSTLGLDVPNLQNDQKVHRKHKRNKSDNMIPKKLSRIEQLRKLTTIQKSLPDKPQTAESTYRKSPMSPIQSLLEPTRSSQTSTPKEQSTFLENPAIKVSSADDVMTSAPSIVDDINPLLVIDGASPSQTPKKKRRKDVNLPPIINIPTKEDRSSAGGSFEPHSLWLTREKTQVDEAIAKVYNDEDKEVITHRKAYLQLDLLGPGDVFGVDHLHATLASEERGVSLMSDGAEIIRVNKRFFLQHAQNNTMLKVETMYKEYMSLDDAQRVVYDQERWQQYKLALMNKKTAQKPKNTSDR